MRFSVVLSRATLAASLIGSAAVSAAPVTLQVCSGAACWNGSYQIEDGVVVNWANVETKQNAIGKSVDDWEVDNGLNLSNWSLSMDSDPFVTNNFTLTNTTSSAQTYSLTTTLGVVPAIPNGLMRGSITYGLTNNGSPSATLATAGGSSIYTALIDGASARTLLNSPATFTTGSSTAGAVDFGYPTFEIAPQSIDTNIAIAINFSLTAGDSVAFTSYFEVTPVPVPAAVWLFGSGLLGLVGVARRRLR